MNKIFVVLAIFLGEGLMIYSEMYGARQYTPGSFNHIFWKMLTIMVPGGALLVAGYIFGYNAFKNIWIISVVSITSILLIEPVLAYAVFHQLPTKGAVAGLILGVIGLFLGLFWK